VIRVRRPCHAPTVSCPLSSHSSSRASCTLFPPGVPPRALASTLACVRARARKQRPGSRGARLQSRTQCSQGHNLKHVGLAKALDRASDGAGDASQSFCSCVPPCTVRDRDREQQAAGSSTASMRACEHTLLTCICACAGGAGKLGRLSGAMTRKGARGQETASGRHGGRGRWDARRWRGGCTGLQARCCCCPRRRVPCHACEHVRTCAHNCNNQGASDCTRIRLLFRTILLF